jgi:hypothetical protein
MELSFTELDNIGNKQKDYNYNHNSYYEALLPKSNTQQDQIYNNDDYNNIVVIKNNNQYNYSQTLDQSQKPIINTNANNKIARPKKKQISYDDILSSMNTVVIDGKLEFIKKDVLQNIVDKQQQPLQKKVTFNNLPGQNTPRPQLDKSSYIYNKYFKDYKDQSPNQIEAPTRPLTKNEIIKQLVINKVNAFNERNRIAEIKSTKLLFNNNNNTNIVINSRYIPPNPNGMNHLFRYK